jgi:glucose uptake protein GlcU
MTGAIFARLSGQLVISFIASLILSIGILTVTTYKLKEYKFEKDTGTTTRIAYILTRLITFTIFYFFYLLVVYGFNFNKMMTLFNFK